MPLLDRLGCDLVDESDSPVHDLDGFVFVGYDIVVGGISILEDDEEDLEDLPPTLTRLVRVVNKPLSKGHSFAGDAVMDDAILLASTSDDRMPVMVEVGREGRVRTVAIGCSRRRFGELQDNEAKTIGRR